MIDPLNFLAQDRFDTSLNVWSKAREDHFLFSPNTFAIIFNQDVRRDSLGHLLVALTRRSENHLTCRKIIGSENNLIQRDIFWPFVRAQVDKIRSLLAPSVQLVGSITTSTTSLVSPWTEGLDLIGLNEPEDEILEQPEQHLPMHVRQRTTRD